MSVRQTVPPDDTQPMPLSRSQVNRLGERLRAGIESEADLATLAEYQAGFDDLLTHTITAVDQIVTDAVGHRVHVSGRSKQLRSIVAKLRRATTRLAQLHDIAGCRVVLPDRDQQDAALRAFTGRPDWTVRDFRDSPHASYWAVHVIHVVGGKGVEVQLRTELQHHWAELSEAVDRIFPGAKYGEGDVEALALLEKFSVELRMFEIRRSDRRPVSRQRLVEFLGDLKGRMDDMLRTRS